MECIAYIYVSAVNIIAWVNVDNILCILNVGEFFRVVWACRGGGGVNFV